MLVIEGIHSQLQPMIEKGQLSARKIVLLIELKELIEKYAQFPFIPESEIEELEKKYGAKPEIITWGDYFQTEVASRFFYYSDADFEKVIHTIHFDIISSILIFKNKSEEFKRKIKEENLFLSGLEKEQLTEEEEQLVHLGILLQYYEEMGLENAELDREDKEWFESFVKEHEKKAG